MNSKSLRNWIFTLHRYLGLALGLMAIIIGLTGSLLIFHAEIQQYDEHLQSGTIIPQGEQLPIEVVLNTVKKAYAGQPDVEVRRYYPSIKPDTAIKVILKTKASDWNQVFINPYTGVIINPNPQPSLIQKVFDIIYPFHTSLLGGDIGTKFVGIVGLLFTILSITGIILWPGWRKLLAGFKIKWNAHPKRVNFDLHKVAGVITSVFLVFTFFTGFCWNFSEFVNPIIYAVTFSKTNNVDFVSVPITGKSPLKVAEQVKIAQAALPDALLRLIAFPNTPKEATWFSFNLPQGGEGDVFLDQYSGKVQVSTTATKSLGDRVLSSFNDLHYGTFWGLPSRIFYVFIGFAPLILFITGFVMWRYRH